MTVDNSEFSFDKELVKKVPLRRKYSAVIRYREYDNNVRIINRLTTTLKTQNDSNQLNQLNIVSPPLLTMTRRKPRPPHALFFCSLHWDKQPLHRKERD